MVPFVNEKVKMEIKVLIIAHSHILGKSSYARTMADPEHHSKEGKFKYFSNNSPLFLFSHVPENFSLERKEVSNNFQIP